MTSRQRYAGKEGVGPSGTVRKILPLPAFSSLHSTYIAIGSPPFHLRRPASRVHLSQMSHNRQVRLQMLVEQGEVDVQEPEKEENRSKPGDHS